MPVKSNCIAEEWVVLSRIRKTANQHQVPLFLLDYILFVGFYIHEALLRTLGRELYSVIGPGLCNRSYLPCLALYSMLKVCIERWESPLTMPQKWEYNPGLKCRGLGKTKQNFKH